MIFGSVSTFTECSGPRKMKCSENTPACGASVHGANASVPSRRCGAGVAAPAAFEIMTRGRFLAVRPEAGTFKGSKYEFLADRLCGDQVDELLASGDVVADRLPVDAEEVHAEDERLECLGGDPATGVAEDLGVAVLEPEHAQRVDARVHAGHDRDTRVGDAVEAGEVEVVREVAVGGEQVVEAHADRR